MILLENSYVLNIHIFWKLKVCTHIVQKRSPVSKAFKYLIQPRPRVRIHLFPSQRQETALKNECGKSQHCQAAHKNPKFASSERRLSKKIFRVVITIFFSSLYLDAELNSEQEHVEIPLIECQTGFLFRLRGSTIVIVRIQIINGGEKCAPDTSSRETDRQTETSKLLLSFYPLFFLCSFTQPSDTVVRLALISEVQGNAATLKKNAV